MKNCTGKKKNVVKKQIKLKLSVLFKVLLLAWVALPLCTFAQSQKNEITVNNPALEMTRIGEKPNADNFSSVKEAAADENGCERNVAASSSAGEWQKDDSSPFEKIGDERFLAEERKRLNKMYFPGARNSAPGSEKFHWKPALIESGIFLGIKHGFRLTQEKTTRELGGPFFRDWGKSVKNLRGWNDGDSPFTNNFAHPLQGGVTGRIFVNNSERAKSQEFGKSKKYWESRLKAFVWSAAWSTQFEFGPVSEATIGNVGLRQKNGHSTMAWTDLVMTPTVGTGVLVGEDMIDRYVLKNWLERKNGSRVTTKIKILRSVLTPTTSFSNLLRGKFPWKRDTR